jgi:DNA-binding response OmpR family regulator/HPt (histidine-containing phosphotransfer) domain-containing protein
MDAVEFNTQLNALRKTYKTRLPQTIGQIHMLWEQYLRGGDAAEASLVEMRSQIHKIAGSGSTFGFSMVSEIADRLELLLQVLTESGLSPSTTQIEQIKSQIFSLETLKYLSNLGSDEDHNDKLAVQSDGIPLASIADKLLYIVDDEDFARKLALQLSGKGFKPEFFLNSTDFEFAFNKSRPDVVLMDMRLQEGLYAGAEISRKINAGDIKPVPIIFISVMDDFQARLQAVRAGATHFFKKPFDIELISQVIANVSQSDPVNPYRVLIIDDDIDLTTFYRLALESVNMEAVVENDPLNALEALKKFEPDLILLDVNLPNCNGIELATIIRQYQQYDLIPIVFLTTEWRKDTKLASINLGSDDFLSKPIAPWYLVETLRSRIKRARILRAGIEKIKKF